MDVLLLEFFTGSSKVSCIVSSSEYHIRRELLYIVRGKPSRPSKALLPLQEGCSS